MKKKLIVRQTLIGCCLLYALGIVVCFSLQTVLVDWSPWLTLLSSFAPFLFLPAPLMLLIAWQSRLRLAVALAFGVCVLFILLYGSLFLPRKVAVSAADKDSVVFMTFNLGPGLAQPDQIVAEIENANADVVAVQEMTLETARIARTRLASKYPYLILDAGAHSTGLLSRHPIIASEWFQPAGEGRSALYAQLTVNGLPMHIFAPHPFPSDVVWWEDYPLPIGLDDHAQQRQLADIANRARKIRQRVIVMGDLNITDQTRAYPELSGSLRDAYREAGWGFGFTFPHGLRVENLFPNSGGLGSLPVPGPLLRLDYIFHSDGLVAEYAEVVCRGGSDHCYLIVKLRTRCSTSSSSKTIPTCAPR